MSRTAAETPLFVPRQLQKTYTIGHPAPLPKSSASTSKTTQLPPTSKSRGSNNKEKPDIDPTLAREIVFSLELVLGSENEHTSWLTERMRDIDGCRDYVHFAALMDCPFFADQKPPLTQILLRRALGSAGTERLEVSKDGYHLRLKDLASRAALRDENTVYIEPSIMNLTRKTGMLTRKISERLPKELMPVVYVQTGDAAWAFVTLGGRVEERHAEDKKLWPEDWIVLTKAEWKKRDEEYRAYRERALKDRHLEGREKKREGLMEIDPPLLNEQEHKEPNTMDIDPLPTGKKQEQRHDVNFAVGLIVMAEGLHPDANKPLICSFMDRMVGSYCRKKGIEDKVEMKYIDHAKGGTTAHIRVGAPGDAKLLVKALEKRRRAMRHGEDRKGVKVEKGKPYISGAILQGDAEMAYWQKVQDLQEARARKKTKQRSKDASSDLKRAGSKRHRILSVGSPIQSKKTKFDD